MPTPKITRPRTYVFASLILLAVWIAFGSTHGIFGSSLPALGKFLNPGTGLWQNSRPGNASRPADASVDIDHPLAKGDIFYDDLGIPHIYADDALSATFLTGYSHAVDRLWQMDISTRATEGRLSEVLGERTRARDRSQIRKGYRVMARRAIDSIRLHFPEDMEILEAYSAGVNSYLDHLEPEDYPVEYKLLNHAPLRWSPYRSALFMKGMSQSLSSRSSDAAATLTRELLGGERFRELFPDKIDAKMASPVIPGPYAAGTSPPPPAPASAPLTSYGRTGPPMPQPDPDIGSNNWAVSGSHSNTRRPMLASDPHLNLTLPSIWYEMQIVYPGCDARGVGFPGAPGLAMGYNDHIAWGETNGGHDVTDWYRIEWTDSSRTAYLLDGEVVEAELVTDTIFLVGGDTEIVTTPWTYFGPVPYTDGTYAGYAMRYLAQDEPGKNLRPHSMATTFTRMMEARDYGEYRNAIHGFVDPIQNFAFAAADGDIALSVNGFMPLRKVGEGRFLRDGSKRENNWPGYVTFNERPLQKNPARGYISSANQVSTGPKYPHPYFGYFDEYRGRNINRVLEKTPVMTQREMKELQNSAHSLLAEELAPLLIARLDRRTLSPEGVKVLKLLSEWDYVYRGNSRAPTLFEDWRERLYRLTFDEFPRDSGYLRPETWRWIELIRTQPNHAVFDIVATKNFRETEAILTQRAFDEMLEELDGEFPGLWYEARDARVHHLGRIPGFGSHLIKSDGGRSTPRVLADGFGGSWRMVVETGPNARAWGTLPGGPSGNPASPLYDNSLQEWMDGRYHELTRWSDRQEARLKASGHLTFQ